MILNTLHMTRHMTRAVYIGGFGNGKANAERVASALETYYAVIDSFTFSEAMDDLDRIRRSVHDADVITHSAGMLAIMGTNPNRIAAFSPPLPSSVSRLIGKTGLKSAHMICPGIGIRSIRDIAAVNRYVTS